MSAQSRLAGLSPHASSPVLYTNPILRHLEPRPRPSTPPPSPIAHWPIRVDHNGVKISQSRLDYFRRNNNVAVARTSLDGPEAALSRSLAFDTIRQDITDLTSPNEFPPYGGNVFNPGQTMEDLCHIHVRHSYSSFNMMPTIEENLSRERQDSPSSAGPYSNPNAMSSDVDLEDRPDENQGVRSPVKDPDRMSDDEDGKVSTEAERRRQRRKEIRTMWEHRKRESPVQVRFKRPVNSFSANNPKKRHDHKDDYSGFDGF